MINIKHNIKLKKLLYFLSKKNFVEVLNVIYDNKTEIISMNDNITTLMMDSLECICLFELDYKDTFMNEIRDVLGVNDSLFLELPDTQKEVVAITLLMAVCYLIFDNVEDINMIPADVLDECKIIQNKLEKINSNSNLVNIINNAMIIAMNKIYKKDMINDILMIKKCFSDYINILYGQLYNYSYGDYNG